MTLDEPGATAVQPPLRAAEPRTAIEVAGLLLVLSGTLILVGGVLVSLDDETLESAGDFLAAVGGFARVAVPLLGLGLLVSAAPRLFITWDGVPRSGLAWVTAMLGLVATSAATAASVGAAFTFVARSMDNDYGIGAGEWVGQAGFALASIAVMMLSWILVAALGTSSSVAEDRFANDGP